MAIDRPANERRAAPAVGRRPVGSSSKNGRGGLARSRKRAQTRATSTQRALAPWLLLLAGMIAVGAYYQTRPREASDPAMLAEPNRHTLPQEGDPVARFHETRVGQVLFMEPDGRHCRRVLFDNQSGGFRPAGDIECVAEEASAASPSGGGGGRLDAIREGFRR